MNSADNGDPNRLAREDWERNNPDLVNKASSIKINKSEIETALNKPPLSQVVLQGVIALMWGYLWSLPLQLIGFFSLATDAPQASTGQKHFSNFFLSLALILLIIVASICYRRSMFKRGYSLL